MKKKREKRTDWAPKREKGKSGKEKKEKKREKKVPQKRDQRGNFFLLFNLNTVRSTRRLVLNEMQ